MTRELRRGTYILEGDYAIGPVLVELLLEIDQTFNLLYPTMDYPNIMVEITKAATAGHMPPTEAQLIALRR